MAVTKILIDWEALETAVERNSPHTESFVEKSSGQVLTICAGEPDAAQLKAKVAANIEDYVRVEPASSREQYRWMEQYVGSVADAPLKQRLQISIDGKGAFRRFKDVLLAYPAERERWFSYRSNHLHWHIQNWLSAHDLEGSVEPPWGDLSPPEELEKTEASAAAPNSSIGESLRRQARELIDEMTPLDLPSAIAFLEFLHDRGVAALQLPETPVETPVVALTGGPKIVR